MQKLLLKNRLIFFRHLRPPVSLLKCRMIFKVLPISKYFTVPNIKNLPGNLSKNPHKTSGFFLLLHTTAVLSFRLNSQAIIIYYFYIVVSVHGPKKQGRYFFVFPFYFTGGFFVVLIPSFLSAFFSSPDLLSGLNT